MKLFTCSKLGENHYLTELPGITHNYLYGQIYASCLSSISNHPSRIKAETELKCNTGI